MNDLNERNVTKVCIKRGQGDATNGRISSTIPFTCERSGDSTIDDSIDSKNFFKKNYSTKLITNYKID